MEVKSNPGQITGIWVCPYMIAANTGIGREKGTVHKLKVNIWTYYVLALNCSEISQKIEVFLVDWSLEFLEVNKLRDFEISQKKIDWQLLKTLRIRPDFLTEWALPNSLNELTHVALHVCMKDTQMRGGI